MEEEADGWAADSQALDLALRALYEAKLLLSETSDETMGLQAIQNMNEELSAQLSQNQNLQNLNAVQQMRKFYDDVTNSSARVGARIRAVESVQWLDLDDKYGIR
jgi:hypothetical protein